MNGRVDDELVLRYVSGRATETERAEVEEAAARSDACHLQLCAAEYLRDHLDFVWETMTAAHMGELWRAVAPPAVIRLYAFLDGRGKVVGEGSEEWQVAPPEDIQSGVEAAGAGETARLGIAAGPDESQRPAAWCIPLGKGRGYLEVSARSRGQEDKWTVSCNLSGCEDSSVAQEARIQVFTDAGKEYVQMSLQDAAAIPLKSGLWRIELCHAEAGPAIEIRLGASSGSS